MNYYEHHIGDYAQATAHLTLIEDAVYSRILRWYYAEEKPLPPDERAICRIVRAVSKQEREAVTAVLADFFVFTEEGYRQKRCDDEIERYRDGQVDQVARRENEKERQHRARDRRKLMFDRLREQGVVPAWDTPTSELETALSRVTGCDGHAPVTHPSQLITRNESHPVTRDNTAIQTPDTRHQEKEARVSALSCADLVGDGLSEDLAFEWLAHRKRKRANLTPRAWATIKAEGVKAKLTPAAVVERCIARGWTGFEAEWVLGGKLSPSAAFEAPELSLASFS